MKKTLLLAGIATFFAFSVNASCNCEQQSQTLFNSPSKCTQKTPSNLPFNIVPVVGADFVYSVLNFSDETDIIKEFAEDEYKAFSVSLGAKFNSYFGIEAFYQHSEEGESTSLYSYGLGYGKLKTSYIAYGADLIGYLPTNIQNVTLLGSLGLGQYEFEAKYDGRYGSVSDTEDGLGIRIGLGMQYNFNNNTSFRVMGRYSHIDSDYVDNMIDLTAGLRFYFM